MKNILLILLFVTSFNDVALQDLIAHRRNTFDNVPGYMLMDQFVEYAPKLMRKTGFALDPKGTVFIEKYADHGRDNHELIWINSHGKLSCTFVNGRIRKLKEETLSEAEYLELLEAYKEDLFCRSKAPDVFPQQVYLITIYTQDDGISSYFCIGG